MEHVVSTAKLPYPNGWFAVAFSRDLKAGKVLRRRLMGEDIVVYRTRGGTPVVTKPFCPHLGAHLGYGGKVKGEEIVCPFHGFAFGPSGSCTRTGYGTKPPKVRLETYQVCEKNGTVFAWWHAEGRAPYWELPELRDPRFGAPIHMTWPLTSYPQDIQENSVDAGHYVSVHKYRGATVESYSFDGVESMVEIVTRRPLPFGKGSLKVPYIRRGFGLGVAKIVISIPAIGLEGEVFFLTTPTDPHQVDFRVSAAIRGTALGRHGHGISWLLSRTVAAYLRRDLYPDFPLYDNKAYVDRPRLAEGDGPIQRYRRWAGQFYSWPADSSPADAPANAPATPAAREPDPLEREKVS